MPPEAAALAEEIDQKIEEDAAEAGGEGQQEQADTEEEARIASLMGWKAPKDWRGDPPPGGLKSARDFLAEVPKVLKATRDSNDRLKGQIDRVAGQVAKLTTAEKNRMSVGQEAALEAAMEAGDIDGAKKILAAARQSGDTGPDEPAALTAFKERNDWFGVDDEATAYATALDTQFAKAAGGVKDPDAHMRKVEAGVKKRFPELFGDKPKSDEDDEEAGQARRRAPLVARGGRGDRPRSPSIVTPADLTPAQRRAADSQGVSHADYAKAVNQINKEA